jgi:hypothetical protein
LRLSSLLASTDSFESYFDFLLRERRSNSLDDMMNDAIEVEVNLIASGKIKSNSDRDMNKVQDKAQPSTSQTSEERFEMVMKTMDKMMARMSLDNKPNTREQANLPPRNQIRPTVPQIIQRDQRNQGDQQIRPPFQNNYVNENYDNNFEDNMHCYDGDETEVFLTNEEHDHFMDANEIFMQENDERLTVERRLPNRVEKCHHAIPETIIFENGKCLQTLQREILPKNLRITYLLQVSPKRTLLQKMLWTKESRRKNPRKRYLKQERRQSPKR